ncbi:hypothetical protein YC2023_010905 [Brassica napus]
MKARRQSRYNPLQLLQAQEAQARPAGSSMRILSFGLWAEYSFSIKPSDNFDQSPPWGQHLILIKEKEESVTGST